MIRQTVVFIAFLSAFTLSSISHAQYQWHIVHANQIDTTEYGFQAISCNGENCSALCYSWSIHHNVNQENVNVIFHSSDGGLTWDSIPPSGLPQQYYTWNSSGNLVLYDIEQIDSVHAMAVGAFGITVRTADNWNTWRTDTVVLNPDIPFVHDTIPISFSGVDFSTPAEGYFFDNGDAVYFSTVDSGLHCRRSTAYGHSYGNGMFQEIHAGANNNIPDTILTTYNDWATSDTSHYTLNGPFLNGDLHISNFYFGPGDTLAYLAFRYDSTGTNPITTTDEIPTVVRSTDLGLTWEELPVPRTHGMEAEILTALDQETIVVAGFDSLGEILVSRDRGTTWELDTVPLDDGHSYFWINAIGVTGSGRIIASIVLDTNSLTYNSAVLAYLEPVPSSVAQTVSTQANFTLYPNPATNILNIASPAGTISISDPLGRSYAVPRNGNALDISTLPPGVYFVSDGVSRAKFVKE
jgi:Secretion system C-terminal sorting domain